MTKVSSLSSPSPPPPLSALDTSAFSSDRDARILAAHALLCSTATALCRGGYQSNDYYDDRGYGGNNDDYNDNYNDSYGYDDRGSSVRAKIYGMRYRCNTRCICHNTIIDMPMSFDWKVSNRIPWEASTDLFQSIFGCCVGCLVPKSFFTWFSNLKTLFDSLIPLLHLTS